MTRQTQTAEPQFESLSAMFANLADGQPITPLSVFNFLEEAEKTTDDDLWPLASTLIDALPVPHRASAAFQISAFTMMDKAADALMEKTIANILPTGENYEVLKKALSFYYTDEDKFTATPSHLLAAIDKVGQFPHRKALQGLRDIEDLVSQAAIQGIATAIERQRTLIAEKQDNMPQRMTMAGFIASVGALGL